MRSHVQRVAAFSAMPALGLAIILGVWELVIVTLSPAVVILPSPLAVARTLGAMVQSPEVLGHVAISVKRVGIGFAFAIVTGIPTGVVLARTRLANSMLAPFLKGLRFVIPFAWLPIASLWFGVSESGKYFITWYAAYFLIVFQTEAGLRAVDPIFTRAARTLGARKITLLWRVDLPAAAGFIFTGLRLGLAFSWIAILAAELVNATSGIGYYTLNRADLFETSNVLGAMIIIGVVGLLMDRGYGLVQRWLTGGRWE